MELSLQEDFIASTVVIFRGNVELKLCQNISVPLMRARFCSIYKKTYTISIAVSYCLANKGIFFESKPNVKKHKSKKLTKWDCSSNLEDHKRKKTNRHQWAPTGKSRAPTSALFLGLPNWKTVKAHQNRGKTWSEKIRLMLSLVKFRLNSKNKDSH